MKTRIVICALFLILFSRCTQLIECEGITEREAIFLIDVTDDQLFGEIETDLRNNLPLFMQKTGLGNISACERFTLSVIPITANETLDISSESIKISRKGQSYQAVRNQSDPTPIVRLLQTKLVDFAALTKNPEITSGSSIVNVLLRSITQSDPDTETTLLIFSDMIENNQYLNMYRQIPEAEAILSQLVDPMVLDNYRKRQHDAPAVNVIVVSKPSTVKTANTNQRNVRQFWSTLFTELDISNVRFIDNLTNI